MPSPLPDLLAELLGPAGRLILVSNRGPVAFERSAEAPCGLTAARGSGGLVTALAELGRHAPITWIAAALSDGDRLAARGLAEAEGDGRGPGALATRDVPARSSAEPGLAERVRDLVEEALPGQDLRLVLETLPDEVYRGYYHVVANPFLWFLQHQMYALPYEPMVDAALLDAWRTGYRPANVAFAEAVVRAAEGIERPVVLLQDYHLYLAAAEIRARRPDSTVLHFTHIPWPAASLWQVLPQGLRRAICEGLLAADIVGLQTDRYAGHFLDTVAAFVHDARVDRDGRNVRWRGRRIRVRSYPISLDPDRLVRFARSQPVEERLGRLRERLARAGDPALIVRADRIEPSKNALRGFLAYEELLARRPELRRSSRFLAVHAPTRTELPEYNAYAAAVREVVARINGMAEPDEQPIWLYDGSDYAMVVAALRAADVVLVNPVLDGMNLVAKEAVLVGERDPTLVLSETAGAAEQLAADALPVAPADVIGTADQLERGLLMDRAERRARARRARATVREQDIAWWLARQLRDLAAVRRGAAPPSRRLRDTLRDVEAVAE
ncbi:MAG TPA: trehalose-6-phosphate synthase [Candidatus Limnocylindrales bacterium]